MDFYLFLPGQWWDRDKPVSQLYDELLEQAVLAEQLGYDGIWLAEQNLVSFLAAPEPLQLAAMIAQRTERIRIGVAVFVLPFHHPLRLAGAISQIDQLSGGRFDAAVGRGASPYQMRQFEVGRQFGGGKFEEADSRALFNEHLQIMVDHWTAEDALSHDGRFFSYSNATVLPPPLQLPHPPLWIAALSVRSMELAVKLGFDSNFIFSPFREPFSHVEDVYGAFLRAMEEQGRARSSAKFAVNRMTYVGEPDDTNDVLRYVRMNHRIIDQQLANAERVNRGEYAVEHAVEENEPELEQMHANIAFGVVDEVREKIGRYARLGVDSFSAWHNVGQSHERVVRSMELFAKEIMPRFR
jgi:alkanesulfonate monooxygenase SsuD/methylene tetrahydromethanopterin reductase-like flavin-dependent oxidoreductase (luciferase family)